MAAETLKGKGHAPSWAASVALTKGRDWRLYGFDTDFPLPSELVAIKCPFTIEPWTKDTVPIGYWGDTWHYIDGQIFEGTKTPVPWTGYWLCYEGKVVPVENFARVWFEIQKRDHIFEATKVTHHRMAFAHDPLPGIDLWALRGVEKENLLALIKESQGDMTKLALAGRALNILEPTKDTPSEPEKDEPMPIQSSETFWGQGLRRPQGDGDDPFTLADLDDDEEKGSKHRRLEGNPPKAFDGDRARTIWFLTQFKRFMLMNWKADIAKDPITKCCYFLALFEGSKVEGWCEWQYAWLDKVEANPRILSYGMTAWDALEQDFRHSFIDYMVHEKAHDNLRKLKMSRGNVNQYIADFKFLAQRTGIDVNNPTAIRLFSEGMPFSLAESCIKLEQPKSFKQWAKAAQVQQRNYILI